MVYRDGVWADPVSLVICYCFNADDFTLIWLLKPPPTSRVLPNPSLPVRYLSTGEGTDIPAQVVESSTSPAAAKPQSIKDNIQSEVSNSFYPARNHALYQRVWQ